MADIEAQSEVEEVPRLIAPMIIKPGAPEIGDSIYVHSQYGLVPSPSRNPAARIIDRQGTVLINSQGSGIVFSINTAPSLMNTVSIMGSPHSTSVGVYSRYTYICDYNCCLGWCVEVCVGGKNNTDDYSLSCYEPISGINLRLTGTVGGTQKTDASGYLFSERAYGEDTLCNTFPSEVGTAGVFKEHVNQIGGSIDTAENEECGGCSTYQIAPVFATKSDWERGELQERYRYSMVKEETAAVQSINESGEVLPKAIVSGTLTAWIQSSIKADYRYFAKYRDLPDMASGTKRKSKYQEHSASVSANTKFSYSVGQSSFMFCPFLAGPRNIRFWCKLDKPIIEDNVNKSEESGSGSGNSQDEMFRLPVTMSISMWKMELEKPKNGLFNYKTIPSSVPSSVRDAIKVSGFKRVKQIGSTNVSASSAPGKPVFYTDVEVPMPVDGIYMFFVSVGPGNDEPWIYRPEVSKGLCTVTDYSQEGLNMWSDLDAYPACITDLMCVWCELESCKSSFCKDIEITQVDVCVSQGYSVYITQTPPYSSGS